MCIEMGLLRHCSFWECTIQKLCCLYKYDLECCLVRLYLFRFFLSQRSSHIWLDGIVNVVKSAIAVNVKSMWIVATFYRLFKQHNMFTFFIRAVLAFPLKIDWITKCVLWKASVGLALNKIDNNISLWSLCVLFTVQRSKHNDWLIVHVYSISK